MPDPQSLAQSITNLYISLQVERSSLQIDLQRLREELEALAPAPVAWRKVPCGKKCQRCPHGPYPYLRVKKDGKWRWKYLGKGWQPPEGFVRAGVFKAKLSRYRRLLRLLEEVERKIAHLEALARLS